MGTWGDGLFDSDSALDAVGELTNNEEKQIAKLAGVGPTRLRAEQLAARVGLLLQLSPYSFEGPFKDTLAAALVAQQPAFASLKPAARTVLARVQAGEGEALSNRTGKRKSALRKSLGGYLNGVGERSLLGTAAARKVLRRFGRDCLKSLKGGLRSRDLEDLHRTGGLAMLGLILLVDPPGVPVADLKKGLARLETLWNRQQKTGETDFWDRLVPNARLAFELAIMRYGTKADGKAVQAGRRARKTAARAAQRAAAKAEKAAARSEGRATARAKALRRGRKGVTTEKRILFKQGIKKNERVRELLARLAGVLVGRVPVFQRVSIEHGKWSSYEAEYRGEGVQAVLREKETWGNPRDGGCTLQFVLRAGGVTIRVGDSDWESRLRKIDLRAKPCDAPTQRALRAAAAKFLATR